MSIDSGSRLFCLLTILLLPALAGEAVAEETVSVTFPAGVYHIQNTDSGQEVNMDGYGRLPDQGKPYIPSKIFYVALPPAAQVTNVTFEATEGVTLDGRFDLAPVSLIRLAGVEENPALLAERQAAWDANYKSVYEGSDPYPAAVGAFVGMSGYRKYNLAEIRISPMAWNPVNGSLVLHDAVTARVSYTVPETLPTDVVLVDNIVRTEEVARTLVSNYDQAQAWYPQGGSGRGLYDYVIITLDSLTAAVQPLVDWEVSKGRTVYVATTTWINANYTGYDLAEKQRNFLRDKYPSAQWGIEDVCLVGHYDDVPMRRTAQDVGYGRPETDYYYAELSKPDSTSWDADGDHQYGENSDPIDFTAEVNVGRIPWSDVATVTSICNKSVAYEMNADPTFKQNILLLGGFFWSNTDNAVLMEYKTNPANCPWMSDWTRTCLYEQGYSSYPMDYDLKWASTRTTWSGGKYAFVNWAGHGNPTGSYIMYSTGEAFVTNATCNALNDSYPAIIFADACSNSDTDNLNIGQAMLKRGGVGFLGATKVAFGSPGWSNPNHGSGQSLDFFFTSCVTSGDYTQGQAQQYGLREMYTRGLWGYDKYETFEWGALWGQPDLGMGIAPAISFEFNADMPEGVQPPGLENTITLEIRDGLETYVPGSGKFFYRFDSADPYTEVALTSLGGNQFEAILPNTAPGDLPEFYFRAEGDGGTTLYSPFNAPTDVYDFDVCFVDIMVEDDFESATGWTVTNTSVSTGAFERANPVGTDAQPEDDHSPNGTMCYVTGPLGGSVGQYDLDGGPTRLFSPVYDLSSGDAEISFYYYFYHSSNGTQEPLDMHITNNGSTWVRFAQSANSPSWTLKSFKVSDYVTPTANIQIRISAEDNPNDSVVEALIDDLMIQRFNFDPELWADGYEMSTATGGTVDMNIDCGAACAGRPYLLLGTLSGTTPGYGLPGGMTLPINWDAFTDLIMVLLNTPVFDGFMGNLDGLGTAQPTLLAPNPLDPILIGETANFAFTLGNPFDLVSNAIPMTFTP